MVKMVSGPDAFLPPAAGGVVLCVLEESQLERINARPEAMANGMVKNGRLHFIC